MITTKQIHYFIIHKDHDKSALSLNEKDVYGLKPGVDYHRGQSTNETLHLLRKFKVHEQLISKKHNQAWAVVDGSYNRKTRYKASAILYDSNYQTLPLLLTTNARLSFKNSANGSWLAEVDAVKLAINKAVQDNFNVLHIYHDNKALNPQNNISHHADYLNYYDWLTKIQRLHNLHIVFHKVQGHHNKYNTLVDQAARKLVRQNSNKIQNKPTTKNKKRHHH